MIKKNDKSINNQNIKLLYRYMTTPANQADRKIQKTGGSSYTITLPKQWITGQNLSEQDELKMFAHSAGTLCLMPRRTNLLATRYISLESQPPNEIIRELLGSYLAGAEQIILTSYLMTQELRQMVRQTLVKLVNFEIFESTSTKIVLKYSANSTVSAKEYVNKAGNMVISMLVDAIESIEKRHRETAAEVIERDVDIDRIHLIVSRQFNQFLTNLIPNNGDQSLTTLNYYKHVSIRLERIADHIVRICHTFLQLKPKENFVFSRSEITLAKKLVKSLELCVQMIDTLEKNDAHILINEFELVTKNSFINRKIINENSINILIMDSLERIRSYIANIAEETVDYCNIQLLKRVER